MRIPFIFKFPLVNVIIIGVITVFLGSFILTAGMDNDLSKMLRKDNPAILAWDATRKIFGSSNMIVIGLKTGRDSVINPEYIEMIDKISQECEKISYSSGTAVVTSKTEKVSDDLDLLGDFESSSIDTAVSTIKPEDDSDLLGDFAEVSDTKQIERDKDDKTPPAKLSNVIATQNNDRIVINWEQPADDDFDHVEINWLPRGDKTPLIVHKGVTKVDIGDIDFLEKTTFTLRSYDINGNASKPVVKKIVMQVPENYPLVESVLSITNVDFMEGVDGGIKVAKMIDSENNRLPESEDELNKFRKKLSSWDLYKLNLISDDYKSSAVYLKLRAGTNTDHHKMVYDTALDIVNKYKTNDIEVYSSGLPAITVLVGKYMAEDMRRLIPFVLIVVLLTLYSSFKRISGVVLPTLCVVISSIWTVGLMSMLGKKIDLIASTIPVILIAVGSAYGIHIITHYYEKMKIVKKNLLSDEHNKVVVDIVKEVGLPVFLASITTIAGFMSFVTTPIDSMVNFGLFTSFGIFTAVLVALILIPSILLLSHKPDKVSDDTMGNELDFMTKVMMGVYHFLAKRKYRILFITIIIVAVSLYGMSKIKIDSQIVKYFKPDSSVGIADKYLNDNFAGTNTLDVTIIGPVKGSLAEPDILYQMDRLSHYMKNKHPEIKKVIGYHDFIKRMNQVMHYEEKVNDGLLEENGAFFLDQLNKAASSVNKSHPTVNDVIEVLNKLYNYEGKSFDEIPMSLEKYGVTDKRELKELISQYLLLYSGSINEYSGMDTLMPDTARLSLIMTSAEFELTNNIINEVKEFANNNFPAGYSVRVSGAADLGRAINELVVFSQIWSFLFSFVVVFIIISISYKSFIAGIIGVIPLSVAVFINFGIMGFAKIELSMATAIIASIAIGIGVDYTIHFLAAYSIQRKKSDDIEVVTKNTLLTSGKAIVFNAASVGFGFAVMLFSNFVPLVNVGILMCLIMGTSSIGALMLLPVMLNLFDPKFLRK